MKTTTNSILKKNEINHHISLMIMDSTTSMNKFSFLTKKGAKTALCLLLFLSCFQILYIFLMKISEHNLNKFFENSLDKMEHMRVQNSSTDLQMLWNGQVSNLKCALKLPMRDIFIFSNKNFLFQKSYRKNKKKWENTS